MTLDPNVLILGYLDWDGMQVRFELNPHTNMGRVFAFTSHNNVIFSSIIVCLLCFFFLTGFYFSHVLVSLFLSFSSILFPFFFLSFSITSPPIIFFIKSSSSLSLSLSYFFLVFVLFLKKNEVSIHTFFFNKSISNSLSKFLYCLKCEQLLLTFTLLFFQIHFS